MRIRMITTAAGPNGVWPAGSVQRVDQETGETLIRYGFAEAVDPVGRETATAVPAMERAVDPVTSEISKSTAAAKKRPPKKSTK